MSGDEQDIRIDLVTEDQATGEWVLHLIEEGPWPVSEQEWRRRLSMIQGRVLAAFDLSIDGLLANEFPESRGERIRIQIDSPSGVSRPVEDLVDRLIVFFDKDKQILGALAGSPFVSAVRITTGHRLGRFAPRRPSD